MNTLIPCAVALLALNSTAHAQVQWMRQGGLSGEGRGMATDASGNAFTVGSVGGPALFDDDTTDSHFADAFLAKYDAAGTIQWVRTGGGELIDQANDVALDADGNAYVTGFFSTNGPDPTVHFDGTEITGLGSLDLFLAKYDASGTLQWIRSGGGTQTEEGRGVTITTAGLVVVSGYFQGTAQFGGQTVVSAGFADLLLLAYDADGTLQWLRTDGGSGDEKANKLQALANGDVAVVGSFQGTTNLAGDPLSTVGLSSTFLARYDGSGNGLWSIGAGSTTTFAGDEAYDVGEAPNGDLVFCGDIVGTVDLDGITLVPNGGRDIFIARCTSTGNALWAHHAGGPQADHGYGLAVDVNGDAYLTGQADDGASTVFDSITLAPFGNEAVFLAKYDAAGAIQWVRRYAPGLGRAVAMRDAECLYFTGGASGIVGQPAFDNIPWQYEDRAIFTAAFCSDLSTAVSPDPIIAGIACYPNPVQGLITLTGLPPGTTFLVLDNTGRIMHQGGTVRTFDVSAWPTGIYAVLSMDSEGKHQRTSFVVAH